MTKPTRLLAPLTVDGVSALIVALAGREPSPEVRARIERLAARRVKAAEKAVKETRGDHDL
jgi:hypothetical protein